MHLIEQPDIGTAFGTRFWPAWARVHEWIESAGKALKTHLRGGRPSTSQAEDLTLGTLDGVIEDLRNLNQHTESDFLGIGGKLMEFLQAAEGISSGLNAVTVLISGEHGRHASEVLMGALERCRQMEARAVERTGNLESLRVGAVAVRNTFSGFEDFVSTFRALCTLTRIETARLGGAGADFGSLTEDVESLAETMGCKAKSVLEAAILLDQRVETAVVNLSDVDLLLKDFRQVIAGVMSGLDTFSSQQASAVALSSQLVADCNSASSSIKDAVTSIQFHDITRQQVEHVIDALGHLYAGSAGAASPRRGSRLPPEAGSILKLQASQLANAEGKFASSVAHLTHDLDNIAACVREMAGNGRSLLNASENGQESLFLKMEQCMAAVLKAAGSFDISERASQAAAGELDAALKSMRDAAGEIRTIDLQLLRIALNACLQAARIGTEGDTLGVLAGALQDLAVRSRGRSEIVGEALDSMTASVAHLSITDDPTGANVRSGSGDMAADLRATIEELHSCTESSFTRIREVSSLASQLCDDISAALTGFTAGRLFSDVLSRCRGNLTRLASEAGTAPGGESRLGLEEIARRYTMQAERDVHAATTNGFIPEPTAGQAGSIDAAPETAAGLGDNGAGELGDNVELF